MKNRKSTGLGLWRGLEDAAGKCRQPGQTCQAEADIATGGPWTRTS